jgi:hypothetical protein
MPQSVCPGCRRTIPINQHEMRVLMECARCKK